MKRVALAFAAVAFIGGISPVAAQADQMCCRPGLSLIEGKVGVIIADDSKLCQVKYADGQIYRWISWNLQPAVSSKSAQAMPEPAPPRTPNPAQSSDGPQNPAVLKPSANRTLVYGADRRGRFTVAAAVTGAPVRFLVDTLARISHTGV